MRHPKQFLLCCFLVLVVSSACAQQAVVVPLANTTVVAATITPPTPTTPSSTPAPALTTTESTPTSTPTSAPTPVTITISATPTLTNTMPLSITTNALGQPLPPFQPLRNKEIIDRPFRNVRALTDGKRKYKTAIWGPSSEWIAAVPQDGPGMDIINSKTGEVVPVVTDTFVLEPVWEPLTLIPEEGSSKQTALPERLLIQRTITGHDHLDRYYPAKRTWDGYALLESDVPIQALSLGLGWIAYNQDGHFMFTPSPVNPAIEPFQLQAALTANISGGIKPNIAWTPIVTSLEDVQTLILNLASYKPSALSSVGEGWWLPRWAPQKARLALTNINGRIGTVLADGSARYDLGPGDTPAWSPDGERIAYGGASAGLEYTTRDIHVVDWQGRGPRIRLTRANPEQFYVSPSWSPDDKQLAFVEIDSGQVFVGDVP